MKTEGDSLQAGSSSQGVEDESGSSRNGYSKKDNKIIGKKENKKPPAAVSPKKKEFSKILAGVRFSMSGFENPFRSELRNKALEMGAKYSGDWDSRCTHLV